MQGLAPDPVVAAVAKCPVVVRGLRRAGAGSECEADSPAPTETSTRCGSLAGGASRKTETRRAAVAKGGGICFRRAPMSKAQWYANAVQGGSAEHLLSIELRSGRQRWSRWRGTSGSAESRNRRGVRGQVVPRCPARLQQRRWRRMLVGYRGEVWSAWKLSNLWFFASGRRTMRSRGAPNSGPAVGFPPRFARRRPLNANVRRRR